jgi:UDP-N-acetylmuramate-alanine ligase
MFECLFVLGFVAVGWVIYEVAVSVQKLRRKEALDNFHLAKRRLEQTSRTIDQWFAQHPSEVLPLQAVQEYNQRVEDYKRCLAIANKRLGKSRPQPTRQEQEDIRRLQAILDDHNRH